MGEISPTSIDITGPARPGARARRRGRLSMLVGIGGLVLGCAACSSSSSSGPTGTGSGPTTSTVPAISTADLAQVRASFETLFDLSDPALAPKVAVIEDGSALRTTLAAALKLPLAKLAKGASVVSVAPESTAVCAGELLSSPCVAVTFDILGASKAKPLLANEKGYAVEVSGKWLVAKSTICSLLTLTGGGATPKGC
jgi:hypothetical protein